jgi:hypothetical protein
VPVAAAQPSGGGGGQNAQSSQIAAAGAYNQRGPGASGQNVQTNQNNQYGGRQAAVQAQQGGQSGHAGRGGQQPKPFQCRVQGGLGVELVLGADNIQYFPCRVRSKNNKDMNLVLIESKLQGGLVYGGSVSSRWKSKVSMSRKMPVVMSLLSLMMALLFCFAAPAQAFVAYDCVYGSNVVEAYSLLEPAQCSVSGFEHRYEQVVNVEIVQQKRERTVSIFRCHVVESVFLQYCGHSSAAGVTRYIKFREPLLVEPEMCRRSQQTVGNITIAGRVFRGNMGMTTSHSFFLAGGLDSGHHCSRDTLHLGDSGKHDYQSAQTVIELTLTEEFAKVNELTGKIPLPGDLVARAADKTIRDSIMGTMVWQYKATTCPLGLTQLFRGMIKIFSNDTANFVDAVAILEDCG